MRPYISSYKIIYILIYNKISYFAIIPTIQQSKLAGAFSARAALFPRAFLSPWRFVASTPTFTPCACRALVVVVKSSAFNISQGEQESHLLSIHTQGESEIERGSRREEISITYINRAYEAGDAVQTGRAVSLRDHLNCRPPSHYKDFQRHEREVDAGAGKLYRREKRQGPGRGGGRNQRTAPHPSQEP